MHANESKKNVEIQLRNYPQNIQLNLFNEQGIVSNKKREKDKLKNYNIKIQTETQNHQIDPHCLK